MTHSHPTHPSEHTRSGADHLAGRPLSPTLVAWCERALASAWAGASHLRTMAVVTGDGFEVAASHLTDAAERRLAAIASSLHAVSQAAVRETRLGAHETVLVSAADGILAVTAFEIAGQAMLLVQVGGSSATAGALYVRAKEFAQRASALAAR
ncbi:MAG TPA: roadblock/LC7 domain-containing protein [Burkholderiaceae bacterium]|nr:roadblock/LC7 domain-containing protein [Burkholderiaceae bacterium]